MEYGDWLTGTVVGKSMYVVLLVMILVFLLSTVWISSHRVALTPHNSRQTSIVSDDKTTFEFINRFRKMSDAPLYAPCDCCIFDPGEWLLRDGMLNIECCMRKCPYYGKSYGETTSLRGHLRTSLKHRKQNFTVPMKPPGRVAKKTSVSQIILLFQRRILTVHLGWKNSRPPSSVWCWKVIRYSESIKFHKAI